MERLLSLLPEETTGASGDVYLVNQGEAAVRFSFEVAESLRDAGFSVTHHCGGGSFKAQMRKADASGAAVAVIVGDDEAAAREATVKPLRDAAAQTKVPLGSLAQAVRQMRGGTTERNS
jgi:histidyl-tRNA synthetase